MARRGIAEVLIGAAVLVIAAGFLAFAVAHSGRASSSGYKLRAQFDHVDGLTDGADVRIAGVKVGSVIAMNIDPKTFLAEVTFTVRDGLLFCRRTPAPEITSESLLGGKYLNLSPGGDEKDLAAGGTITITQSSISIEQLLGKFIFGAANLADKAKSPDQGGSSAK